MLGNKKIGSASCCTKLDHRANASWMAKTMVWTKHHKTVFQVVVQAVYAQARRLLVSQDHHLIAISSLITPAGRTSVGKPPVPAKCKEPVSTLKPAAAKRIAKAQLSPPLQAAQNLSASLSW